MSGEEDPPSVLMETCIKYHKRSRKETRDTEKAELSTQRKRYANWHSRISGRFPAKKKFPQQTASQRLRLARCIPNARDIYIFNFHITLKDRTVLPTLLKR